jgi:hypothetical protein
MKEWHISPILKTSKIDHTEVLPSGGGKGTTISSTHPKQHPPHIPLMFHVCLMLVGL